jgi:hypothetical protein
MTAIAGTETGRRLAAEPGTRAALTAPVQFATAARPAALTVDVRWETPAGHPLGAPPLLAVLHGAYGHTLSSGRSVPGQRPGETTAPGVRHEHVQLDGRPVEVAARVIFQPAEFAPGTDRVLLLLDPGEGADPGGAGAVRLRAESELVTEPVVGAVPVRTRPSVLLAELARDAEDGWTIRVVGRGLAEGLPGLLRDLDG